MSRYILPNYFCLSTYLYSVEGLIPRRLRQGNSLQHSFGEFYKRGVRKVNLGIDADSLIGALRLYEKAGMSVHSQFDKYEKEIRTGKEISVQSIEE